MGGAVTQHLGWRWCLWIFLPPTGLIALVFLLLRIPDQVGLEKSSTVSTVCGLHHKLDFVGFLIFTPACVMFLLAVSWGGSKYAWGSAATIGLLCGSGVMAAIFGGWMWHYGDRAMIPPRIVMKPVVLYGCILSMVQGGAFLMLQYYLPLWFQSVKGASPEEGGVMMLPTCVAQIVAGIGCSALLRTIPYAPLWSFFGNAATAIASGLMTTFIPSTSSGKWIGYQIIGGVGRGIAMQMPVLAAQSALPESEISIATANLLFFQYFGGTFLNCIAKTVFINALGPALAQYAPHVDPKRVIAAGATDFLHVIRPQDVEGVKLAYNKALTTTFWLPTAFAIVGFVFSYGLGRHRIGIKKPTKKSGKEEAEKGSNHEDISVEPDGGAKTSS
ncbi:MFS general substrate transporter [Trematosphaeria pertusa]|uniref:MFS general substrate transporter n=1 Tax=Trematosphaeria pertusa TaxID=390896 RepID=A0A6A6ICM0_9PLEO|nr:MFS general substrate transporter [Trematosphaeria pertusa]KAF2248131.1 MFS general substrate transporter [Trematosphaeria pertusa]